MKVLYHFVILTATRNRSVACDADAEWEHRLRRLPVYRHKGEHVSVLNFSFTKEPEESHV